MLTSLWLLDEAGGVEATGGSAEFERTLQTTVTWARGRSRPP